jgi:hypothetical protein
MPLREVADPMSQEKPKTLEQYAREILRCAVDDGLVKDSDEGSVESLTSGDLVTVANMLRDLVLESRHWKAPS